MALLTLEGWQEMLLVEALERKGFVLEEKIMLHSSKLVDSIAIDILIPV